MSRTYSATDRAAQATNTEENEPPADKEIPDFPVDCLPPVLRDMALAIADVCQVPIGMAAPMLLAVASASIGNGVQLRFARGNVTHANLFILISKVSGSGGSVTFKHALAPFVGYQKMIRKEFEENEKPRLDAEHADLSQQSEAAKRELKDSFGPARSAIVDRLTACNQKIAEVEKRQAGKVIFVTDITPEKLAEIMSLNGEVMAHFNPDAGDALGIILGTRYGSGKSTNDSLWLKGYTGEPSAIYRKNSPSLHLNEPCLSVLFVATPETVSELYQNKQLCTGGLLPRFLSCNPGAQRIPLALSDFGESRKLPTEATQPYEALIFSALAAYRMPSDAELGKPEEPVEPTLINCTEGASKACVEDDKTACENSAETSDPFAARHMENAARLAIVLHTAKHAEIRPNPAKPGHYNSMLHGHARDLDEETMRNALQIRDWFSLHQKSLREPERVAAEDSVWEKAQEFMRDHPAGATARDLYTGKRVFRDAAQASRLLAEWVENKWIVASERKHEGAGRPAVAYKLAVKGKL